MSPEGMESHIVSQFERGLTTTVDNIEHIESQSIYGIGIIKVFLQPSGERPVGHCADYFDLTGGVAADATRDHTSFGDQLHGFQRSGSSPWLIRDKIFLSSS